MENLMFTCYFSPNLDVILYGSVNHIIDSDSVLINLYL